MYKDFFGSDWAGEIVSTTAIVVVCGALSLLPKVHVIYPHCLGFILAGNLQYVVLAGLDFSSGGSSASKSYLQDNWLVVDF